MEPGVVDTISLQSQAFITPAAAMRSVMIFSSTWRSAKRKQSGLFSAGDADEERVRGFRPVEGWRVRTVLRIRIRVRTRNRTKFPRAKQARSFVKSACATSFSFLLKPLVPEVFLRWFSVLLCVAKDARHHRHQYRDPCANENVQYIFQRVIAFASLPTSDG